MPDPQVNLAAGMTAKTASAPAPAPAANNLDLSAGMVEKNVQQPPPAAEPSTMDKLKDFAESLPKPEDALIGFGKGLGDTAHGIGSLINKIPMIGEKLSPKSGLNAMDKMDEAHGVMQHLGKAGELVMEFMSGDEAIKGLSMVDKLSHMQQVAKFMKEYPKLGAILASGMRQFGVGTAQGVVKDAAPDISLADTGTQAAEEGAAGAATGMVADGAVKYGRNLLKRIRPGVTTIAGETMPKLASQQQGADALAGKVASVKTEPAVASAQQEGSKQAIKNIARQATEDSLNRVNESRIPRTVQETQELKPIANKQKALSAGAPDSGTKQLGAGSDLSSGKELALPEGGAQANGAGKVTGVTATMDSVKPPNVSPVDVKAASSQVHSFGDAADQVEGAAKQVYKKLDSVSNGEFTAMREQRKAAQKVLLEPSSMDAWSKAQDKLGEAEDHIDAMFEAHKSEISKEDWKSANAAWRDAKVLDRIHTAVEGSFNGIPESVANRTGLHRGISGNKLQSNLGSMLRSIPQADAERVIGKDGLDNLFKIADLTSTPERRAAFGNVADNIAAEFIPKRGMIGAAADDARRFVLHGIATNPRAAKMVEDAIKMGVHPKMYAPLIAQTLRTAMSDSQQ